jgi:hypothetical protein
LEGKEVKRGDGRGWGLMEGGVGDRKQWRIVWEGFIAITTNCARWWKYDFETLRVEVRRIAIRYQHENRIYRQHYIFFDYFSMKRPR